jgi:hypothetical protein
MNNFKKYNIFLSNKFLIKIRNKYVTIINSNIEFYISNIAYYFYKLVLTKSAKFFMKKQNCYGNLDKILSSLNYWGLFLLAAFTLWTCSDSDWEILLYYFEKFVHFWKRQLSLIIISSSHYRITFESKKHIFARKFIEGKIDLLRIFFLSYKNIKNYTFNFVLLEQN